MADESENLVVAKALRRRLLLANMDIETPMAFGLEDDRYEVTLGNVLASSGWFLLAESDIPALADLAARDAGEEAPVQPDLPPLPFPRCWFEVRGGSALTQYIDPSGSKMNVIGFSVTEQHVGTRWRIVTFAANPAYPDRAFAFESSLLRGEQSPEPDATVVGFHPEVQAQVATMSTDHRDQLLGALAFPIFVVHLVTTLDVTHAEIPTPRPDRRRWAREFGTDHPKVYFVDLARCGEAKTPGTLDHSPYRHRWLVRGHYRLHPTGTYDLPRGKCLWVRPHAKGPAGAPWKGRPVHRLAETAA